MQDTITWITENGENIAITIVAIHGAALAVVNLTPTPKDNAFLAAIYKPIEWLAGVLTKKAKE